MSACKVINVTERGDRAKMAKRDFENAKKHTRWDAPLMMKSVSSGLCSLPFASFTVVLCSRVSCLELGGWCVQNIQGRDDVLDPHRLVQHLWADVRGANIWTLWWISHKKNLTISMKEGWRDDMGLSWFNLKTSLNWNQGETEIWE